MTEKGLMDNIIDGLKNEFNNNPPPQKCVINKIYEDNRVDVKLDDGSFVKYVEVVGNATKGNEAVLCFLNGSLKEAIVITANADLHNYYTKEEIDEIIEDIIGGDIDLKDYYTKNEINAILSSYVTVGYANSRYALINHTHSQYITRDEISDLDINLATLNLVPYSDNPNGIMCFDRVQKTIEELDISLTADTMSNGYLKIEANLIERSN